MIELLSRCVLSKKRRRIYRPSVQGNGVEALELRVLLTAEPALVIVSAEVSDPTRGKIALAGSSPVAVPDTYMVNENQVLETQRPATGNEQTVVTRLQMTSDPGNFVGNGQTYDYLLTDGTFNANTTYSGNLVTIGFHNLSHSWTLNFAAPSGERLEVGTYSGATRYPFNSADTAGLDVSGDGRGSNTLTGTFAIKEITFAPTGELIGFWATFDQYAEQSPAGLHGEIQYNATLNPTIVAESANQQIANQPVAADPDVVTQLVMISDRGDYVGDGQSYRYSISNGRFTAYGNSTLVSITFQSDTDFWNLYFTSPAGEPLAVGTYNAAAGFPFDPSVTPGFSIFGNGRSGGTTASSFTIREIAFAPTGELRRFWATFEQHAELATPALHGVIQYNALVDATSGSVIANDSDPDADPLTAVLASLPKHGRVTMNPDGTFVYVPDRNFSGIDKFTYRATDGAHDSSITTVTLNVKQVNAAPIGQPKSVVTKRNKLYAFKKADFRFGDPGNKPRNAITAVRITTVPVRGSLSLHGVAVTAGTIVAIADIKAKWLTFIPDASGPDAVTSTFTFQVQDDGGTADGGVDTDYTPREMTITVS